MSDLKEALDDLLLSADLSSQSSAFKLSWTEQIAGFDIFDLTDRKGKQISIGDEADYLQLFMVMSEQVFRHRGEQFEPFVIANDSGNNRLFVRYYTEAEHQEFKYANVAMGHAAKQLPESSFTGKFSFFGEITLEKTKKEGFEKEARKTARTLKDGTKQSWEELIEQKADFLKTDLYVFQLLKLYSWGFIVPPTGGSAGSDFHFVRPQARKPRGANRNVAKPGKNLHNGRRVRGELP